MIVFNLSCSEQHIFDGWFRSVEDFDRQATNGLVECPFCGDKHITKKLSAPRINSGASAARTQSRSHSDHAQSSAHHEPDGVEVLAASMLPGLQEHMLRQFKNFVLTHTENVGVEFAETARRIHYGEESHRNIRGRVSADEALQLREEGIETVSLPPGVVLDEGLQ
jgi:hypothetical protein